MLELRAQARLVVRRNVDGRWFTGHFFTINLDLLNSDTQFSEFGCQKMGACLRSFVDLPTCVGSPLYLPYGFGALASAK